MSFQFTDPICKKYFEIRHSEAWLRLFEDDPAACHYNDGWNDCLRAINDAITKRENDRELRSR